MQEERNYNRGCGVNNTFSGGIFGDRDNSLLLFILIFLILFTDFGCGFGR